jgi:2-dehydro-3-deoxygluconokinase
MVAEAVASGVSLCLDVNHRARLWSAEQAGETLAPLLAQADIVVCADRDARALFGAEAAQPAVLRDRWAPRASVCVVTRGERGCAGVSVDGVPVEIDAVPTTMVDRLGLGDAFVAGLLRSLLADGDLAAALRSAAALAALKATVSGDLSLARSDDLDALLDQATRKAVLR